MINYLKSSTNVSLYEVGNPKPVFQYEGIFYPSDGSLFETPDGRIYTIEDIVYAALADKFNGTDKIALHIKLIVSDPYSSSEKEIKNVSTPVIITK